MSIVKRPAAAVICGVLALGVAIGACGGGEEEAGGGGGGGSLKGKTVAILGCTNANPWCNGFNKDMGDQLRERGAKVSLLTTNFDAAEQGQQFAQAIAQRPELIVSYPADSTAICPSLRRAKQAKVPVFTVDSAVTCMDLLTAAFTPDHKKLGGYGAENIQEGLEKEGVKSGKIIAITGTRGQLTVEDRTQGFMDQMAKTPEFEVVETRDANWDVVRTAQIAQQLFAKYGGPKDDGGIVGVYTTADYMAPGVVKAAKQAGIPVGRNGLVISGSNCAKTGIDAIKSGNVYGGGLLAPSLQAEDAMGYLEQFQAGKDIPKNEMTTKIARITQGNVDDYAELCGF